MKNTKKIFKISGIVLGLAFIISIGIIKFTPSAKADFSGTNYLPGNSISATTTTLASSASQIILATSTARLYVVISNDGSSPVFLSFGMGNPATLDNGILLNASSSYSIEAGRNLYFGAVTAITTGSNTKILVTSSQ